MPKKLSESEREYIKARLLEEARSCLTQFGMRKTTVDELVNRVNIPKGTFYLFYPSKELLIFEVFNTMHDELQADVMRQMEALKGKITVETMTELLFGIYKQVDSTFLYSFAAGGDLELLVRKLPPDVIREHTQKDDFSMEKLLSMLPVASTENHIKTFSAALRAVFCLLPHKREIGEDVFDDTVKTMLRGVLIQLFEGKPI
jgi:AcrR family transcriptional regulator